MTTPSDPPAAKPPPPRVTVRRKTPEERAATEKWRKNYDHLQSLWSDLLRDHPCGWVRVHGDCQVEVYDNFQHLQDSLSDEERREGVLEYLAPTLSEPLSRDASQPSVNVRVLIAGIQMYMPFLIDPAAAVTTISSRHAFRLFGDAYLEPEFQDRFGPTNGADGAPALAVPRARLFIDTGDGFDTVSLGLRVAVAEPNSPPPEDPSQAAGAWSLPNLLGRDVLERLDFDLSDGRGAE